MKRKPKMVTEKRWVERNYDARSDSFYPGEHMSLPRESLHDYANRRGMHPSWFVRVTITFPAPKVSP